MPMPPFPAFLSREVLAAWQASIGSDTDGRVSKQHLVSAVILRRFHDPAQHKLEYLSVEWPDRKQRLIGARGAGAVTDFLAYATASAEEQWKGIEDRIPAALAAVDGGNTPQSDEHQATIIGIMALHMARNHRFSEMHANAWQELVAQERERFLNEPDRRDLLRREFYQRHGLYPAGLELLGELYDTAIQEVVDGQMPERLARLQVEIKFFQLLLWLPRASFHLLRPETGEFLIGDSPTVLLDYDSQRFGGVWEIPTCQDEMRQALCPI